MSELVSVKGDPESHGGGALHASNTAGKMFIEGKEVVVVGSTADADGLLHPTGATNSATGTSKMFVNGISVHRNNDLRACGASTIVSGQSSVYAS